MTRWFALVLAVGLAGCPDTTVPKLGGSTGTNICAPEDLIDFLAASDPVVRDDLWIAFVDVGQGDAIWIRTPGEPEVGAKEILIDAGECAIGSGDCGIPAGVIPDPNGIDGVGALLDFMNFAEWQPGRRIHYFIATHPDKDHYGGGWRILQEYDVENIVLSGIENDQTTYLKLIDAAEAEPGATILSPAATTGIGEGRWGRDVTVTLLSADRTAVDDNDGSIVVMVEFRGRRILLTGDAEDQLDEKLVARWKVDGLQANVLKAGHHGGQGTSSQTLLDAVFPTKQTDQYAIISAGRRDNLPAEATLERLLAKVESRGLYRTDRGDEGKTQAQAPGDDHILVRVRPDGQMTICYAFADDQ